MTPVRLVEGPLQQDWVDDAACLGAGPSAFFPRRGSNGTLAKRICAVCPVRVECLDYAVSRDEQHGIWGGLDIIERRAVKKSRVA